MLHGAWVGDMRAARKGGPESGDGAAHEGQKYALSEELDPDMAFGCSERPSQADLRASFEDRDHHGVGHSDRSDQQRHGPQPKKRSSQDGP